MDEQVPESNKHEITSEHAVLIPAIPSIKSVMPYVEAVAVVIGSCHIHSVFEDADHIKIYLKDRRFVDILVNNGVSILGRQVNVDYAVPRADKVTLSNIDPIIPDSIITKLLCFYGTPISSIIHEKIAVNSEYSHIECGKRKIYMKIFPEKKVPTKINFTYQNMYFRIDVLVEPCEKSSVCESLPTENEERVMEDEDDNDLLEVESTVNVKPNIEDLMQKKQPTDKQLAYRNRGKNKANPATNMASRLKRRAKKGWYKTRHGAQTNNIAQRKKNKLRLAVRRHLATKRNRRVKEQNTSHNSESVNESNNLLNRHDSEDMIGENSHSVSASEVSQSVSQYPLDSKELEAFLSRTKFHRSPLQVAEEFLGDNYSPITVEALKSQLHEYVNINKDATLKLRVKRILAAMNPKDKSMNDE
ncbi:uncharacterized protein TNIN_16791 [Trichonephila inaurata madagascariensis]|uniref:Uncharacterized protein n=1 Tax=Trichonephila inaurata madagascariensis TaxID=2747483 RepID=A0A8X6I828_9ARAC|nr:uncharacterized protein TNIN_456611 [Trichonephila inaurata madagascariensis]GFY51782.1 uncharacterized protein TNIN_16791 [Trichonephila inaurata madagascariensis]